MWNRDRPPLLEGALTIPDIQMLQQIRRIVCLLQPADCIICGDKSPLLILFWIGSWLEGAGLVAMPM